MKTESTTLMEKLNALLDSLEKEIPNQQVLIPAVSQGSVGWHIEHCLLTITGIMDALHKSNPANYKWRPNLKRFIIHTIGIFPRGKVKAPASIQPAAGFNAASLQIHLDVAREKLKTLNGLDPNHYFKHPLFDNLNVKPTIRFLQIHTHHHLKIIKDIMKHT